MSSLCVWVCFANARRSRCHPYHTDDWSRPPVLSGDWCLHLALRIRSSACHKSLEKIFKLQLVVYTICAMSVIRDIHWSPVLVTTQMNCRAAANLGSYFLPPTRVSGFRKFILSELLPFHGKSPQSRYVLSEICLPVLLLVCIWMRPGASSARC